MAPQLTQLPLVLALVASLVALFGSAELGRHLGARASRRGADPSSTLEAAMLGLLALMIGFTFSIALARYEARRDAVLNEANSIGTTALRAVLLPAPHDKRVLGLLRDYLQVRLDLAPRTTTPDRLSAAVARSDAIQKSLWQEVKAIAAENQNMVPVGVFITTLNEMIDNQENNLIAAQSHLPIIVLAVLYAMAISAIFLSGYNRGVQNLRTRLPIYIMAAAVSVIFLLIQDLNRPSSGYITIDIKPMSDVAASFPQP